MKKTEKLLKELDERIENIKSSEEFRKVLEFFSKFYQYSYRNQMLIEMQSPQATYVAGYKQWQKKFNRQVKKGEEGIAILAPFTYQTTETKIKDDQEVEEEVTKTYFKAVYVFDISQTEGEPVPELDMELKDTLPDLLEPLIEFTEEEGIELKIKPLSKKGLKGYSTLGEIVINSSLNKTEQASTLIHELAHELIHSTIEQRKKLSKEVKEMEAEAVAFVVLNKYEVEPKSDRYLALYKKNYDLQESLERIHKIAARIMENIRV